MRYVVRLVFFGNAKRPAIKDIAIFYHKREAIEYEQRLYEELSKAPHFSDFIGIDALRIDASSEFKIYQTKMIPYDERKRLEGAK